MASEVLFENLPEHWELLPLGEVCIRGGGDVQTGPFGSQLHASDYVPEGIPSIMPQNIGDNRVNTDNIARISEKDAERLARYRVKKGDVVYSRRGDVERRALIRESEDGWLCGTGCLRIRFGAKGVDPLYAAQYLGDPRVRDWVVRHAQGATMPNLNTSILSELPFVVPPREEQLYIANVLGTLDDKIELNRKMNEALEAMARALFKSWFVDFDPVRAKAEDRDTGLPEAIAALFPDSFEDSEVGKIPCGWRATTLGKETERHGGCIQTGPFGSQLHASDYSTDGVPVIMPQDIVNRRVSTARIARVRESDAERLSRHRVQAGDIIYSRRGDVERHAQISKREAGWLCGTGCLLVRMGPQWPSSMFMSLALDRPESRAWITQHAIGATMPNLNTGILSAVPLVVPPLDLLQAFARLAEPIEQSVSLKNAEARSLETLRDTLLPKLITGELQIPQSERLVEVHI